MSSAYALDASAGGPAAVDPAGATPTELALEIVKRERARSNLIDFACYVDDNYVPYPIHRLIARHLERVEAGLCRRLAIFVPPAVGKSRLASELFPAWFFGRNPGAEFIEASYDAKLAFGFGRNVRNLILHPLYHNVFPGTQVAADASSMDSWKTTVNGEYKAEGVGGGLIGFHANIAVIDDPLKNYDAASSPTVCEALYEWYCGVLLNRLRHHHDGPGSVVLIMQRWSDNDLGGRVERLAMNHEEEWEIVSLPSIADAGDPLGRAPGEALLPDGPNRRTIEELLALRARNPRLFSSLHQQRPISEHGDIFNVGWLRLYRAADLPERLSVYISSDWALTKGGGDYTVHIVFGVDSNGHIWLLDLWRKQSELLSVVGDFGEGVTKWLELCSIWGCRKAFGERIQLMKVVSPVLQRAKVEFNAKKAEGRRGVWTILEPVSIMGLGGKASPERVGAFAGAAQMGFVHVPEQAQWRGELEFELSRFPNSRFDDQVDALSNIGMKLDTLNSGGKAVVPVDSRVVIKPGGFTFNEYVDRARRRRLGLSVRTGAMVVPFDTRANPLDEDVEEGVAA